MDNRIKQSIALASMRKEAGPLEWAGEHIVGPVSKGVGKFYNAGKKTDYEGMGENVVAPLLKGVNKSIDIAGGARDVIKDAVPAAASEAGSQLKDWLKTKGAGWEKMFSGGINSIKSRTPEGVHPLLSKIQEHPYLTPALAAILPLLLMKIKGGRREKSHRAKVERAISARPLDRFL